MADLPVNPLDAVVLGVLLLSALVAFARGFALEVLSIAAWIAAAFAGLYLYPYGLPYTQELLGPGTLAEVGAGAAIFLVVLVILSVLSHQISRGLRGGAIGSLDRSLGFLFGLARGGALVCILYIIATRLSDPTLFPSWVQTARSLPAIEAGASWLLAMAPPEVRDIDLPSRSDLDGAPSLRQLLGSPPQPGSPTPSR